MTEFLLTYVYSYSLLLKAWLWWVSPGSFENVLRSDNFGAPIYVILTAWQNKFYPSETLQTMKEKPHGYHARSSKRSVKRKVKSHNCKKKGPNESLKEKLTSTLANFRGKLKHAKHHYFSTTFPDFITNNPPRFWRNFHPYSSASPERSLEEKTTRANTSNNFFQFFTTDNGFPLYPVLLNSSIH